MAEGAPQSSLAEGKAPPDIPAQKPLYVLYNLLFVSLILFLESKCLFHPTHRLYSRPSRPVTLGASATLHGLCCQLGTEELCLQQ